MHHTFQRFGSYSGSAHEFEDKKQVVSVYVLGSIIPSAGTCENRNYMHLILGTDRETDSWRMFMDSKLLDLHTSPVAALVPLKGKLCIIYENMSISLVDVSSPNKEVQSNNYIRENIAGGRSKDCIMLSGA
ncbi:hypothetical protein MTR_3g083700 [Medicago truncatula]|uniref:Uncharacterized protein n=1 Tax=Medicago truncatula TaxID=3880 RepID=G7JA49_MEDTR|nr:hypothetical protein MTR_3g083700 [Medicago truncatula]